MRTLYALPEACVEGSRRLFVISFDNWQIIECVKVLPYHLSHCNGHQNRQFSRV